MIPEQAVALAAGDDVTLEARLGLPPSPRAGVVICHPHPLYGGDMDNPVVVRAVEVCAGLGLATLRFNFRGVGGSTGAHGGGRDKSPDEAIIACSDGGGAAIEVPCEIVACTNRRSMALDTVARAGASRAKSPAHAGRILRPCRWSSSGVDRHARSESVC